MDPTKTPTVARKRNWPLTIAIVIIGLYAVLAWGADALMGDHPIVQVPSPDHRYTADILCGAFFQDKTIALEPTGFHPFGNGRDRVSGDPDEDFYPTKIAWQDNHTLVVYFTNSDRPRPEVHWRDVRIVYRNVPPVW